MVRVILCLWIYLLSARLTAGTAAAEVIFKEDFNRASDGASLASLGWTVKATDTQSLWTVKKGALKVVHFHNPYKGSYVEMPVPAVKKGAFEFDVKLGDTNNHNLSLTVAVFGISTSFHGYGPFRISWNRYAAELEGKKNPLQGLKGRITPREWHHFRIEFDGERNIVEYYVDDMDDPVYRDTEVKVLKEGANRLLLANYGLCSGTVINYVDNLVLTSLDREQPVVAPVSGGGLIVINGVGFGSYRLNEAIGLLKPTSVKTYLMELGLGVQPKMTTRLERSPGQKSLRRAGVIIMVNATAQCLSDFTMQELAEHVRSGASLLVLGGMFSFGKGHFGGTPLEGLLPVELGGAWEVKRAEPPLALKPSPLLDFPLAWDEKPVVFYYHDLKPLDGSLILLRSGNLPLLVERRFDAGRVAAFLGTTCGLPISGELPFWEWKDWPKFLAHLIERLMPVSKGEGK